MKPRSLFLVLVSLTFFVLGGDIATLGQGTDLGTIRGTVTESSGAVVPNASVSVIDTSTGATRQTKTNGEGEYQVFGLRSGTYKVSVTAPGFATQQIDNIPLRGSSVVGINASLKVSSAEEKVEVTIGAPPINTEDSTISSTIGSRSIIELPRDSRDVYQFLYLNPNITQSDEPGDFKFTGFQSYGASFSLDGQRSSGGIFGAQTASEPSLEAVDEVNILSDNFSAEYAGIANIRITTKRGTNQFHGSMFYNNKNSALAAYTLQDQLGKAQFSPSPLQPKYPNPAFNINDIGASIGGPIPKLHNTWFFAAYERDYSVNPVYLQQPSTPFAHPSLYTGNFSLMDDASKPDLPANLAAQMTSAELAADTTTVTSNGEQFQVLNQIPTRLLNPVVQNLINQYFPHIGLSAPIDPTTGQIAGNFQTSLPGRDTLDLGTLRLDHDFSEKDHVYLTFNASADTSAENPVSRNRYPGLGLTQSNRQNDTLNLSYTHVFRSNLVNEVRGGFNKENLLTHSNTTLQGFLSGIGFDGSDIAAYAQSVGAFALGTDGQPQINFSGAFATFDNGGRNTFRPLSQALSTFGDTATWVHGQHSFKFGADFVRNWALDGFALNKNNPRGSMTYTGPGACPVVLPSNPNGDCIGNNPDSFVEFLIGDPPTTAQYNLKNRPAMDVHNWEQGFFAQDDWKVSPHFTLNLGLRYDLITPFIEKNDILVNFDPNLTNPLSGQKGVFVIPSDKTIPFLDIRAVDYGFLTASQTHEGIGRGLIRTDKNNFAPRVGFAWALGNNSVIRGGYGFFFPTSAAQGIRDPIATNGFNQGVTARKTLEGWPGFQHGISPITGGTLKGFGNQPSGEAVPVGLQDPRVQQWNVTFERQIGWNSSVRFSYLGSHAGGLIGGHDLNELPPSNNGFGTSLADANGIGDGVNMCSPDDGTCALSLADTARYPFPIIGEFLVSFGNFDRANSNAFQTVFERRYKSGLMLNLSYTYLDQKSTVGDTANSSLGSEPYNPFEPNLDYTTDGFVSKNRFVAYGVYDLPVGRGRKFATGMSKWMDAVIGGWQTTFNMFAKSGTGYTPFWFCNNCDPVFPGNIGVGSVDAVGDFGGPDFRPNILSNNINTGHTSSGATMYNATAFGPPSVGADFLTNPAVAKRNSLTGPGMWGVNLGVHKNFKVTERLSANIGADIDNIFNHPILAPDFSNGGSGGNFANVGSFNMDVGPPPAPGQQPALLPITRFAYNSQFGVLNQSFDQEGVSARREIRLRLRVTF